MQCTAVILATPTSWPNFDGVCFIRILLHCRRSISINSLMQKVEFDFLTSSVSYIILLFWPSAVWSVSCQIFLTFTINCGPPNFHQNSSFTSNLLYVLDQQSVTLKCRLQLPPLGGSVPFIFVLSSSGWLPPNKNIALAFHVNAHRCVRMRDRSDRITLVRVVALPSCLCKGLAP